MMLGQGGPVKGYVATRPVDFRNGVDGLVLAVQEVLGLNPFCGAVFVFRAKRAVFRPFNCGSASSLFLSVPGSWSLSRSWPHVYVRVRYLNVCSAGAFEACSRNNDVTATTVPADIAGLASGLQSRGRVKRKSCRHLFPPFKDRAVNPDTVEDRGQLPCHRDLGLLHAVALGKTQFLAPLSRSPSQWPGTARSSISAGRSRIDTAPVICPRVCPAVLAVLPLRVTRRLRRCAMSSFFSMPCAWPTTASPAQ